MLQRDLMRKQFAVASDVIVHDIYGVEWDGGSSPAMARTDSAIGLVANAGVDDQIVQNDFDKVPIFKAIHEVVDDYGNVFVRIPKVYIRKTKEPTGKRTWQICGTKRPGFYLPWCFWDFQNNRELPYIDVGKHKASLSTENKLESKPDLYPLISRNIVQFRDYARANGKGYQQLDIHVVDVLQTLFYVEFATLNSQSIMQGFTTGQYSESHVATVAETQKNRIIVANSTADQFRVGQTISLGTSRGGNQIAYGRTITAITVFDASNKAIEFDGIPVNVAVGNYVYNTGWKSGFSKDITASSGSITSNSDGKYPFVYRGIESLWGDLWQFVDGVNITDNQAWVCNNAAEYTSNVFTSPYKQLSYINSNVNGYPTEMGHDPNNPFAELPKSVGGGSTTYYSDYYYQTTGQRIALLGADWVDGSVAGLSCWYLHNSSGTAYVYIGGRLLKKPL